MKRSMVVSIIGRPNVGKSTVYNRLMGRAHKNITHNIPGVTRDRHYGLAKFDLIHNVDEQDAILIDTGGFYPEKMEEPDKTDKEKRNYKFFNIMIDHAKIAIKESDLVLLVVDVREGLIPFDSGIIEYLRIQKKKFWLVINKYDSDKQMGDESEFYTVGVDIDDMFMTSAAHGRGTDELGYRIQRDILEFNKRFENDGIDAPCLQNGVTPREKVVSKVAIVGGPNAGKSTLLNCLIGAERALVSNIPGTTVDPIEGFFDIYFGKKVGDLDQTMTWGEKTNQLISEYEEFQKNNFEFHQQMLESFEQDTILVDASVNINEMHDKQVGERIYDQIFESSDVQDEKKDDGNYWRTIHLVDTAGIRRQKSIDDYVEEQSVFRSLRSITEADVVIYMVDATKGIGHQDRRLIDVALEKGKSLILVLNKIDLMNEKLKTRKDRDEWIKDLRIDIPWLEFCDIVPISAKYKKRISKLKKVLAETVLIRNCRISTGELNQTIFGLIERNPVVLKKTGGKTLKIKYSSMIKANPPTFLLFVNRSKEIPENYKRYLKNGIRGSFDLKNSPVHLIFRTGKDLEKRAQKSK